MGIDSRLALMMEQGFFLLQTIRVNKEVILVSSLLFGRAREVMLKENLL